MKKYSQIILFVVLLGVLFLNLNCKKDECLTCPQDKIFTLTTEDASCTEIYLRIKIGPGNTSREVTLRRDTIVLFTRIISETEIAVTDTNLSPNHTYSYIATLGGLTQQCLATTMDTTSHNFTWQTFTFGSYSSILQDVAVISENDIWAVGEIKITDTSVNGFTTYNAVHWNGNKWNVLRVPTEMFGGGIDSYQLRTVFAFGANNVWTFSIAGSYSRWDGNTWVTQFVSERSGGGAKLWGENSSYIFLVGTNGSISKYTSSAWQKLESGTDLPFQDIWGDKGEILAMASDKFGFGGQYLINIAGNTVNQIPTDIQTAASFSSIWFQSNRKYFLAGNGVYTKHNLSDANWILDPISQPLETYFYSIRGSGLNNIVTVGEGSYIAHFNGVTWKVYNELRNPPDRLSSVAVTENMIVAVGNKYVNGIENYGVVYIGRR